MRIFVTGASGAIGSRLVPQLIDAGHDVIGTHNSLSSAELLRTLGAKPVRLDLLDARAVHKVVLENEPEAIIHPTDRNLTRRHRQAIRPARTRANRA
jgi:nucleoside-diphosphate-sugar epimerase